MWLCFESKPAQEFRLLNAPRCSKEGQRRTSRISSSISRLFFCCAGCNAASSHRELDAELVAQRSAQRVGWSPALLAPKTLPFVAGRIAARRHQVSARSMPREARMAEWQRKPLGRPGQGSDSCARLCCMPPRRAKAVRSRGVPKVSEPLLRLAALRAASSWQTCRWRGVGWGLQNSNVLATCRMCVAEDRQNPRHLSSPPPAACQRQLRDQRTLPDSGGAAQRVSRGGHEAGARSGLKWLFVRPTKNKLRVGEP